MGKGEPPAPPSPPSGYEIVSERDSHGHYVAEIVTDKDGVTISEIVTSDAPDPEPASNDNHEGIGGGGDQWL